jgi:hypothetical protein
MERLRTRIDFGAPVDPLEFASTVSQMLHTSVETQSHLEQLENHLVSALNEDSGGGTATERKTQATPRATAPAG